MSWYPAQIQVHAVGSIFDQLDGGSVNESVTSILWPGEAEWCAVPTIGRVPYRPSVVGVLGAALTLALTRNPLYALGAGAVGAIGYALFDPAGSKQGTACGRPQ